MKVLVTGAGGFVGSWLRRELADSGHEVWAADHESLDVTSKLAVRRLMREARPDAVAHLAGISFAPEVDADPAHALEIAVHGTVSVLEAIREDRPATALLVTGSAEVYLTSDRLVLPLTEDSPLGPRSAYGRSKLAQETAALDVARDHDLAVVVTRAFNHIGPGQRASFVVPALASRIRAVASGLTDAVRVGNLDVARDFSDVRDVVRAYRLILERMVDGSLPRGGHVMNVASGRSVLIRTIYDTFCRLAGVSAPTVVDPALVRGGEPANLYGLAHRLTAATGWTPQIHLERSLADVWMEGTYGRSRDRPR